MDVARIGKTKFYISGYEFAQPRNFQDIENFTKYIKNNNIDTIINVSDYDPRSYIDFYKNCSVRNVIYRPFPDKILEAHEYTIYITHLQRIYDTIKTLSMRNILIHCTAGINRSALVICYLCVRMYSKGIYSIIDNVKKSNINRNKPALTNYTFENLLIRHSSTNN